MALKTLLCLLLFNIPSPCLPSHRVANTELVLWAIPGQGKLNSLWVLGFCFLGVYKRTFWSIQWGRSCMSSRKSEAYYSLWIWKNCGVKRVLNMISGSEVNCPGFLASELTMALFQLSELNGKRKLWWGEINVHIHFRLQNLEERAGHVSAHCQDHHILSGPDSPGHSSRCFLLLLFCSFFFFKTKPKQWGSWSYILQHSCLDSLCSNLV